VAAKVSGSSSGFPDRSRDVLVGSAGRPRQQENRKRLLPCTGSRCEQSRASSSGREVLQTRTSCLSRVRARQLCAVSGDSKECLFFRSPGGIESAPLCSTGLCVGSELLRYLRRSGSLQLLYGNAAADNQTLRVDVRRRR